jgi:hypothetical protein
MIISHRHRFIFIKTRKTAGTSIEIALSRFCGAEDIITPITPKEEEIRKELGYRGPQNCFLPLVRYVPKDWARLFVKGKRALVFYNHIPAKSIRTLVDEENWNTYFKFCFERNPWDKAISWYYWITRQSEPQLSLSEFILSGKANRSDFGLYTINGEIVVDRVGLYENLSQELERIAEYLNLPDRIRLPKAKANYRKDRRHYREVLGLEEQGVIAKAFAREIAHLGYQF